MAYVRIHCLTVGCKLNTLEFRLLEGPLLAYWDAFTVVWHLNTIMDVA